MKKNNRLFLMIGIVMGMVSICSVLLALNNSQASFPWNNTITYGIYIIYVIATILFIFIGLKKKLES